MVGDADGSCPSLAVRTKLTVGWHDSLMYCDTFCKISIAMQFAKITILKVFAVTAFWAMLQGFSRHVFFTST